MSTEATAPALAPTPLLPLEQPRTVRLTVGKKAIVLNFRCITDKDWRQFLEAVVARIEQRAGERVRVETEEPALAQLAVSTWIPGPAQKLSPRLAVAAGMALRMASAESSAEDILSEFVEIRVNAVWSADESGKMGEYTGLVHRFRQPTIDQLRRYKMGVARVAVAGTAENGTTTYPSRLAVALGLYDELIVEVEGYCVEGEPLTTDVATIRKYMDGYHKAIAARELFERDEETVQIGAADDESGDAAGDE